jgi:hypothetical protein
MGKNGGRSGQKKGLPEAALCFGRNQLSLSGPATEQTERNQAGPGDRSVGFRLRNNRQSHRSFASSGGCAAI